MSKLPTELVLQDVETPLSSKTTHDSERPIPGALTSQYLGVATTSHAVQFSPKNTVIAIPPRNEQSPSGVHSPRSNSIYIPHQDPHLHPHPDGDPDEEFASPDRSSRYHSPPVVKDGLGDSTRSRDQDMNLSASYGIRPLSRSSQGISVGSLYNRYVQEDGVLKSTKRKDFFCATIWFPFFLREYYPNLGWFKKLMFAIFVYSNFIFVATAVKLFTILVFFELKNALNCSSGLGQQSSLKIFASLMASVLFIISLLTEFRLSMDPLWFWWKIVKFGQWEFIIKKNDDTSVELVSVKAPWLNCTLRLIIVGGIQVISTLVLHIAGLLAIQASETYMDLVQNCLALIWISNIDEYVFNFMFMFSPYFKGLWRDEIFEETVYEYRDESIKQQRSSTVVVVLKNMLFSIFGIGLLALLFRFVSKATISYVYCSTQTPTPIPTLTPTPTPTPVVMANASFI